MVCWFISRLPLAYLLLESPLYPGYSIFGADLAGGGALWAHWWRMMAVWSGLLMVLPFLLLLLIQILWGLSLYLTHDRTHWH
jgi:hypothetical protein